MPSARSMNKPKLSANHVELRRDNTHGALKMALSTAHAAFSPPPSVPRQFRFHSRYAYPFLRAPSGAHRAELRACPSDPFPLEVPGPVSSHIPITRMRFVKPARGVTLMFGLLPRHSCHPISQSGRGASARETSGRSACNRTCLCVRLATD